MCDVNDNACAGIALILEMNVSFITKFTALRLISGETFIYHWLLFFCYFLCTLLQCGYILYIYKFIYIYMNIWIYIWLFYQATEFKTRWPDIYISFIFIDLSSTTVVLMYLFMFTYVYDVRAYACMEAFYSVLLIGCCIRGWRHAYF